MLFMRNLSKSSSNQKLNSYDYYMNVIARKSSVKPIHFQVHIGFLRVEEVLIMYCTVYTFCSQNFYFPIFFLFFCSFIYWRFCYQTNNIHGEFHTVEQSELLYSRLSSSFHSLFEFTVYPRIFCC